MMDLVELVRPGGTVLDPFAGSASTAIACMRSGRPFVGVEADPVWHSIGEARIEIERRNTTIAATKIGQGSLFG